MKELVILKTDLKSFRKLQVNIKFYQSLGLDGLIISPFDDFNREDLDKLFRLNEAYQRAGIRLILSFDIKNLMGELLGLGLIDFTKPHIRKSLYHFISYLIRHGIRGFYLRGIENFNYEKSLVGPIRELNKNTFFNNEVLSMALIDRDQKTLIALASPNLSTLSLVRPGGELKDLLGFAMDFEKANSGLILSTDNFPKVEINFKNYPKSSKKLILMSLFFLNTSLYIDENNLAREDVDFIRYLLGLKKTPRKLAKTRKILPKEKDVLAFIRQGEEGKLIFFANLTEKEVLLDLAFKVLDYKDYVFLAGSLGRRTLYRTTLLRPYEAVAFVKL